MAEVKNFFYLLSYPRCRSTWFSQFFSTNVSACFHEMLSSNDTQAFYNHMLPMARPYVGSADTNPISFGRTPKHPGPMVVILRPKRDVVKSLLKSFDKHPAFSNKEWKQYIKNTVDMFSICLEWYQENEPNLLIVYFKALEDEKELLKIWRHCVPTHEPDPNYIRHLNSLRITIKKKGGMSRGIEVSRKNRNKSIEEFKKDHLERYDRKKFRDDFYREPDQNKESQLYLGNSTRIAMACSNT